jgi:CSLREA domain-containing protein
MKSLARIAAILLLSTIPAQAAIHTVNSNADTDDLACDAANCTLREAINAANAGTGDTIQFAIGSGAVTIALASALPNLSAPMIIDATTQPGYAGTPIVQLTGINTTTNCLNLRASDTTIRGLDIGNCQDGINVAPGAGIAIANIAIERNFIGTRIATASINRSAIRLDATAASSTLSNVAIGNGTPARP